MSGMTKRQFEALMFIRGFIAENGYSPNYTEIGEAVGLSGRASVHRLIHALRDRGSITLERQRSRSISLPEARA